MLKKTTKTFLLLRSEIWNSITSGLNNFITPSSDWSRIQNGQINLLDNISNNEIFELVMGGPILWAVKTVLQILSYVAGVFWLIDVLKTFLKKSRGPGQNIQINMEGPYNQRKKIGNWQEALQDRSIRCKTSSTEEPPPPYNL